jgi:hypothetical protein
MDLTNAPWRAYEKYRRDGASDLFATGLETLLVNVLFYRIGYQRYLRDRVSVLSQSELRSRSDCWVFESCTEPVSTKNPRVIDDPTDPEASYRPADRFVCEVPDATLLGPVGPGIDDENRIVAETVGTVPLADRRIGVGIAKAMAHTGVRRTLAALSGDADADTRLDTAAVALPPWNNYYHWTMECLPRIRLLDEYANREGAHPDLVVPADRPSWMDETLSLVDYGGRVVECGNGVVGIDRLVVPAFPDPTPAECRWLRDRMRAARPDGSDAEARANRVYVSREDATVRRVRNFDEIRPVLDAHGFETYVLSELGVAEQIDLFANAEMVVAPHGAGLTNVVYADDVAMLELFGDKKLGSFARLAHMLDHPYTHLDCEQRGVNLVVDPERLDGAIEAMTNRHADA